MMLILVALLAAIAVHGGLLPARQEGFRHRQGGGGWVNQYANGDPPSIQPGAFGHQYPRPSANPATNQEAAPTMTYTRPNNGFPMPTGQLPPQQQPSASPTPTPGDNDSNPPDDGQNDTPGNGQGDDSNNGNLGDYMSVVNYWRARLGHSLFTKSAHLEANAMKTAIDGNGNMVHELNPGTFGQVLAPADNDSMQEFEHCFIGGWLCEKPNMDGMNGICSTDIVNGWYWTETGHADILTSESYQCIGCAYYNKILACDVSWECNS